MVYFNACLKQVAKALMAVCLVFSFSSCSFLEQEPLVPSSEANLNKNFATDRNRDAANPAYGIDLKYLSVDTSLNNGNDTTNQGGFDGGVEDDIILGEIIYLPPHPEEFLNNGDTTNQDDFDGGVEDDIILKEIIYLLPKPEEFLNNGDTTNQDDFDGGVEDDIILGQASGNAVSRSKLLKLKRGKSPKQ